MPPSGIINLKKAWELAENYENEIDKLFLLAAMTIVHKRFFKKPEMNDEQFMQQLPEAPFDAYFYLTLIQTMLEDKEAIKQLFSGNTDPYKSIFDYE